ncbi:MAG: hypothetical protein CXR31_05980 [Geobacter sp.]|nr:MAG: hypothetical protein CXR31_05980 [Geobacter sp.]
MDDYQLIKNNLQLTGNADEFAISWVQRWYIIAFCFAPALLIMLISNVADDPRLLVVTGQIALAAGTYLALFQLREKPLLNPIQAVVFLFHWWFAIGPSLAATFAVLRNDAELLSTYVTSGGAALWTVALGLPLYAFCANGTMRYFHGKIRHISFLMPDGPLYLPKTIFAYWLVGGLLALIVMILARFGIVGNQAINYLGGTVSENWFVSALEAISAIAFFATVGVMGYLVGPVQNHALKFKLIAIALIVFNTINAFTSGWKGAMVISLVILFMIMFTWRQKLPVVLVLVLAFFYLLVVEPVVSQMRFAAEVAQITTPEERSELFKQFLNSEISLSDLQGVEINIESPFRYIYDYASRISSESYLYNGPWENTMSDGLLALVPRSIYPEKPELNMGNYFARYLGVSDPDNYINNIGVSIPFEFVGNYGHLAGVLSFGLIGILWTLFCVWLLSENRLATHPLTPLCIIFSLGMEASIGQFLVRFRDLPLVFGAAYLMWIILKKRL